MKRYLRGLGILLAYAVAIVSAAAQNTAQSANNEANLTLNDLKGTSAKPRSVSWEDSCAELLGNLVHPLP